MARGVTVRWPKGERPWRSPSPAPLPPAAVPPSPRRPQALEAATALPAPLRPAGRPALSPGGEAPPHPAGKPRVAAAARFPSAPLGAGGRLTGSPRLLAVSLRVRAPVGASRADRPGRGCRRRQVGGRWQLNFAARPLHAAAGVVPWGGAGTAERSPRPELPEELQARPFPPGGP